MNQFLYGLAGGIAALLLFAVVVGVALLLTASEPGDAS